MRNSLLILGIFLLFAGFMGTCMSIVIPRSHAELRNSGESVQAEVIDVDYDRSPAQRQGRWTLTVQFTDKVGQTHTIRQVSLLQQKQGDRGELLYDPQEPTKAFFVGENGDWASPDTMRNSLFIGLSGLVLILLSRLIGPKPPAPISRGSA